MDAQMIQNSIKIHLRSHLRAKSRSQTGQQYLTNHMLDQCSDIWASSLVDFGWFGIMFESALGCHWLRSFGCVIFLVVINLRYMLGPTGCESMNGNCVSRSWCAWGWGKSVITDRSLNRAPCFGCFRWWAELDRRFCVAVLVTARGWEEFEGQFCFKVLLEDRDTFQGKEAKRARSARVLLVYVYMCVRNLCPE